MVTDSFLNPQVDGKRAGKGLFTDAEYAAVHEFFAAHRELMPTPLRKLTSFARELGVGELLVKDESARYGLNAFKTVGVTYAIATLLERGTVSLGEAVACATAGNHGRAVAHVARTCGLRAFVYVPSHTAASRVAAIEAERAYVTVIDGTYEHAVRTLAADAAQNGWTIVSDTSWEGYEETPRLIMAGYTHVLDEAADQWGADVPAVVFVQGGVGGLVCAASSWFVHRYGTRRPFFVVCEPERAACLLESARARQPVVISGSLNTVMAGLRCSEVSPVAWPAIAAHVDAFVSIPDSTAEEAMRRLAHPSGDDPPVLAGASGACGIGALMAAMTSAQGNTLRAASRLSVRSRVLTINTEGATDPQHYEAATRVSTT